MIKIGASTESPLLELGLIVVLAVFLVLSELIPTSIIVFFMESFFELEPLEIIVSSVVSSSVLPVLFELEPSSTVKNSVVYPELSELDRCNATFCDNPQMITRHKNITFMIPSQLLIIN